MVSSRSTCFSISQRWVFAAMAFFALWFCNGLRVILSIAITEMAVPIAEAEHLRDDTCADLEKPQAKNSTNATGLLYDWDEYTQGLILSSYFWGYSITQLPAASLSQRYGGKHFLGLGVFVPAILTFLTPLCTVYGESSALIVLRVLMGLTSGSCYPSVSTLLARWTAPAERTRIGSIVYAGGTLGTVCGLVFSGLIIRYSGFGWPAVFYTFGGLGILWFPLWCLLCYNSPKQHPFISEAELKYLVESSERKQKPPPAPWCAILSSKEAWAFAISMFGVDWAFFMLASDLPKYMSSVIRFSIEDNGYLSALPYLCSYFFANFCFWMVDLLIEKQWLSLAANRKILTSISLVGPAAFIVVASYAGCNQTIVVVMFAVGMTLMGAAYPSIFINPLDLSPNYSGTLMAIGNCLAAVGGILTPYLVGVLTPNQTIGEWRLVFWIGFVVALSCCLYFLICGSTEIQPWNDPKIMNDKSHKNKSKSEDSYVPNSDA